MQATLNDLQDNYYQILGVSSEASLPEIKQAFVKLARIHHPDRSSQGQPLQQPAVSDPSTPFHTIQAAWDCLQDTNKRQQYDQSLYIQKQKVLAKRRAAIPITLEDCAVGNDSEDAVYYVCRCGLQLNVQDEVDDLLECTACSLVYDTSAVFDESASM